MSTDLTEKPVKAESKQLTVIEPSQVQLLPREQTKEEIQFGLAQRQAKALAESTLIPKDFQGKLSNCMIALDIAQRLNAPPLLVMQNLYIVHGKPSWSSQFLIATFNQCGRFSPLRYEFSGTKGKDDWGCKAYAVELSTGEVLHGPTVDIAMARSEGWIEKAGSKWKTMPEMMLRYRSAAFFVRTVAPELSMGLPMADEAEDIGDTQATARITVQSIQHLADDADADPLGG